MKVEQKEIEQFQPVVITLETREEFEELYKTLDEGPGSPELFWILDEIRTTV